MVNTRVQAALPRRVLAHVEGKSFQIEWLKQAPRGEEVDVVERSKGGTFMLRISAEGGRWLGTLLCQISMGTTLLGSTFRREEPNGTITGTVEANGRGDFLRFVVFNRSEGKFRTICFPAGIKGQGWSLIGSQVRSMLDPKQMEEGEYQAPFSFLQTSHNNHKMKDLDRVTLRLWGKQQKRN
ncbi:hypothetical protein FRX31_028394 [Thalictrum thalictroides]|uniref:Uncharacterized protein n=1 Tax=Thalictrum thalictroides TaxID=46969 RepID=A0A7J6VCS2_THATH|nr:hypothetical protein FRX31_028394 [Thalictrum thalictroides]